MRIGLASLVLASLGALAYFQSPSESAEGETKFAVDDVHSFVVFKISHLHLSTFYGRFNGVSGGFTVADEGAGSIDITVAADSVDSGNAKRDGHLKSPDFLSAQQFPEITFKGKLKKKGDGYEAQGTFTLRGVSKQITVPLKRIGTKEAMGGLRTGFEGEFTISRKAYGINWRPEALGDEITLMLGIEGLNKQ